MNSNNKLIKNTVIYALGDIVPRLLSFLSFPILTTYLTPTDYAVVNYVNTIMIFLTIIGLLCLNTYYLVYYYKMEDEKARQKLLGNLSIFVIGLNFILSIIIFLIGGHLFKIIGSNIEFFPYIVIGIITNLFSIFSILPSALFRVQERPLPLTLLNVFRGVMNFAVTLFFVIVFHYTALGVLCANMFISIVFGVIFLYVTFKNAIWNIDWKQIKHALFFSLPLLPGALSYYLVSMSDRILIDKYLDLNELGIYSTASTLAMILNIITYGAYKSFEPYFFKIYGTSEFQQQFIMVRNGFFFILLVGAMGLSLFSKEFFEVFANQNYSRAYFYVPLILIGIIASSMTLLYGTIITAQEKTKISSGITIFGGILSVILNIFLLPRIGLISACIVSGVSFWAMLIASIYFSKVRETYLNIMLALIVAFVGVYFCVYVVDIKSFIFLLIIKSMVYILCLLLILYLLDIKIGKLLYSLRPTKK